MTIATAGRAYGLVHTPHGRLFAMAYALHLRVQRGNRNYEGRHENG